MAGSHHQDQEAPTITKGLRSHSQLSPGVFSHGVDARRGAGVCSGLCCHRGVGGSKVQQQLRDKVCLQPLEKGCYWWEEIRFSASSWFMCESDVEISLWIFYHSVGFNYRTDAWILQGVLVIMNTSSWVMPNLWFKPLAKIHSFYFLVAAGFDNTIFYNCWSSWVLLCCCSFV